MTRAGRWIVLMESLSVCLCSFIVAGIVPDWRRWVCGLAAGLAGGAMVLIAQNWKELL